MNSFLPALVRYWIVALALGRLLCPTWFQVLAALMPIGAYFFVDQGGDVLSLMGEDLVGADKDIADPILFWLANAMAAASIWWTARVILHLRFDGQNPAADLPNWLRAHVFSWWPRFLGVLPIGIIAWACFHRVGQYCTEHGGGAVAFPGLKELAWAHIGLIVLLLVGFWGRRLWLDLQHQPAASKVYHSFRAMQKDSAASLWAHFVLFIVALFILAAIWISPLTFPRILGAGAMLSLSAAISVILGTIVMHLRAKTGAPLFSVLAALALLFSLWNDNHQIRLSKEPSLAPAEKQTVAVAFQNWLNQQPALLPRKDGQRRRRPVFIVATEGGGIRAAYWTAEILSTLQEPDVDKDEKPLPNTTNVPSFAANTFAISGISGGSIGAAVFDALLSDKETGLAPMARNILGEDHLSPLFGGLLFTDAVQRLSPCWLPNTDRAERLEYSFEDAYQRVTKNNSDRLAQPFRNLWPDHSSSPTLPHLFLNSTLVETGQRLIFSDLAIKSDKSGSSSAEGEFYNALDAHDFIYRKIDGEKCDIPLITAAHASARFTYTNPQGTLSDGQHFVDGGYFEDSGATTAMEIVRAIEKVLHPKPGEVSNSSTGKPMADEFFPVVILISNSPRQYGDDDTPCAVNEPPKESPDSSPTLEPSPEEKSPKRSLAMDLLAPPEAIINTRDARGEWARAAIRHESAGPDGTSVPIVEFFLVKEGIPLPLGWSLSKHAAWDMQVQAWHWWNEKSRAQVQKYLLDSVAL